MDNDAKERITRNINTDQDIERQLKSYFGYAPTRKQVSKVENHVTAEKSNSVFYNNKSNRYYIRDGEGKFRKVTEKSGNIVVNPKNNQTYLRDESGQFKKVVK